MNINLYQTIINENLLKHNDLFPFRDLDNSELYLLLKEKFKLNDEKLLPLIGSKLGQEYKGISDLIIDEEFSGLYDKKRCQENRFVPIYKDSENLCFAFDNPFNPKIKELQEKTGNNITVALVPSADMNAYFGIFEAKDKGDKSIFHQIVFAAIEKNASDIHFNKTENLTKIAFRINGKLYPYTEFQGEPEKQLINKLKLESKIEQSITKLPQDGRLTIKHKGQNFDIRVASLPTVFGEDFVLRIFGSDSKSFMLEDLGFSEKGFKYLKSILASPTGLILVTGATGSGKTTTLYSCIKYLLQERNPNIVTLEDPVEYIIDGIRQSEINRKANYDFVTGLRAILRQDPDIIMVGEIRDKETAKIALDAAYTGHVVLATLHTADIKSTILRLSGFDLDPFVVAEALKGIISQKLVSTLCPKCRQVKKSAKYVKSFIAGGCKECHYTGQKSRALLTEILEVSDKKLKNSNKIETLIETNPFYSFEDDVRYKIEQGIVSEKEALNRL
ncbi:GspE/PulE family protein [Candidatus Margulisiibacteriota bacterium]